MTACILKPNADTPRLMLQDKVTIITRIYRGSLMILLQA